ncbi:MAG: Fur family transcriptional regulator, partial [Candidatus Binataceae bacterium]
HHVHLSADQIFARAAARLPELSRATVYNTLNELVTMGELLEVNFDGALRRYDPNALAAHHHQVCERCGAIRDVHPVNVTMLTMPKAESRGFRLSGVDIVFRGLCARCAAHSPAPRGARPGVAADG